MGGRPGKRAAPNPSVCRRQQSTKQRLPITHALGLNRSRLREVWVIVDDVAGILAVMVIMDPCLDTVGIVRTPVVVCHIRPRCTELRRISILN